MSDKFLECTKKKNAKIRSKILPDNQYVRGCSSDGGKTYVWGEVKTNKQGLMAGKE